LYALGNRFSPLGVSHLSVKSRQQYLLFSVNCIKSATCIDGRSRYKTPAISTSRAVLANGCNKPAGITAIIDQMCVILATASSERL